MGSSTDDHTDTPDEELEQAPEESFEEEEENEEQGCIKKYIVGDYKYGPLCKPRLNPWTKDHSGQGHLEFVGKDDKLPALVAAMLGFQHSLAVVGGTVIPGILIGNQDPSGRAGNYLVAYALITSGICTWLQILHTPIPKTNKFLGSGLLCVIATSFAFLPTTQQTIDKLMSEGKSFDEAYGSMLGVFMVGAIFQSGFSFIPGPRLRKIFPSWLAGLGVFLIGISCVTIGVQQWGGGDDCYLNPGAPCTQVGNSSLPFGSSEYLGLGFMVLVMIILIELFGSPFMRSCSIAIALLLGYLVAALTTDRNGDSYTSNKNIEQAPVILFLWTKTFPIGFYAPALLPVLVAYTVSTIETYGDTTATAEASGLVPGSALFDEALQGGLLGDSVNSFFSALSMVLPSTTLSQNIGIISLTKVASRTAGIACGVWMVLYGVFGKFGALFTSIPVPVLGGMSTFLFANIAISGIKVMTSQGVNRRARFILAVSGAFGIGTILVPTWFNNQYFLDCSSDMSPAARGVCDAVVLTLSTGYAVGCLVALILNGILPHDPEDDNEIEEDEHLVEEIEVKKLVSSETESGAVEPSGSKVEVEA